MCDLEYIGYIKKRRDRLENAFISAPRQPRKPLRVPASNLKPTEPDYSAADTGCLSLIPDFFSFPDLGSNKQKSSNKKHFSV